MPRPRLADAAVICAALVALSYAAFSGVLSCSFLNFDDDTYVTANAEVRQGLTAESLGWALKSTQASNWHPVTWLSHMLDVELFGLDAAKHHSTSLLLHASNAVVLFLLLFQMTGALWRCAFVAALFAVHPLHTESVAWIAERKDVLSMLLWLLTIAAWLRYLERKTPGRYAVVLVLFVLGLMSKPMLVTLPFTLLLIEFWPLKRKEPLQERVKEKLPLFAISAASCVVTVIAQRSGGAFQALSHITFPARVANAAVSYLWYFGKTIWPTGLSVFYPYPASVPVWLALGAALALAGVTALALRTAKRAPYFVFGWLWYVGTLVPVIGLVQVGAQATADRYTYVPLIGVFIAIVWGLGELGERSRAVRYAVAAAGAATIVALIPVTRAQVRYWTDSVSLFEHALAVTSDNRVAHVNLGLARFTQGKTQDAIAHYEAALRIDPDRAEAHTNLGIALQVVGRRAEAVEHLRKALALGGESVNAEVNLGSALASLGQVDEAIERYNQALRLDPDSVEAHRNLGNVLDRLGRSDEAIVHINRALQLAPDDAATHLSLANALAASGRFDEAMQQFAEATRLKPNFPGAYNNMGIVLARRGQTAEAIERFEQAVRLRPDYAEALNNLGQMLASVDRVPESIERLQQAVSIAPDFAQAHNNLGASLARAGRYPEAMEQFEMALRIDPRFDQARANLQGLQEALKQKP